MNVTLGRPNLRSIVWLAIAACGIALPAGARAGSVTYDVTADTSSLSGVAGAVDFQFNPSMATALPASASVTSFASDGTAGAVLFTAGDQSGTLPGNLSFDNGTPQNELTQAFTFGTTISFDVTLSGQAVGTSGPASSTFSFTLFDASGAPQNTGPGGSIVTIDINTDGTTTGTAYPPNSDGGPTATVTQQTGGPTPEPATLLPACLAVGALLGYRVRRCARSAAVA